MRTNSTMKTNPNDQEQELLDIVQLNQNIIQFNHNGEKWNGRLQDVKVGPNWASKEKLGVYNAFTSKMERTSTSNVKETAQKVAAAITLDGMSHVEDWRDLMAEAQAGLFEYMKHKGHQVDLVELVQYITLKTSLSYLFEGARAATQNPTHFEAMLFVGSRLNELLITLNREASQLPDWSEQKELHAALRLVTLSPSDLNSSHNPRWRNMKSNLSEPEHKYRNPLNLLMHPYDNIWRVVLRCFVEIRFRNAANGPEWSQVMEGYLNDLWQWPVANDTNESNHAGRPLYKRQRGGLKASFIVKEALRLYPPVDRIKRQFGEELQEVDIKALQRSSLLGGNDPLLFRPERWRHLIRVERSYDAKKEEEKMGFMPFGLGCPADSEKTRRFAMNMIGMLLGILCAGLGDEWRLKDRQDDLPALGNPLENDRGAYLTVLITLKDPMGTHS